MRRISACLAISALAAMFAANGTADNTEVFPSIQFVPSRENATIAKNVASSKLRLVFFMGLEGSGHHYARQAFLSVFKTHEDLKQVTACSIEPSTFLPKAMGKTASEYVRKREELRSDMQKLAAIERDLEFPGTFMTVQPTNHKQGSCHSTKEASYPAGSGPNKALKYVDLRPIAQLAEEEGVDFRIMYLQRSAKAMLLSATSHRDFHQHLLGTHVEDYRDNEQKFLEYAQVLLTVAAVVHSSLSELGPGFVICQYYDDMDDEDQAREIAEFLAPNEVIAGYIENALLENAKNRNSSTEELPYADVFAVAERIQRKLDVIEAQHCVRRASLER